MASQPKPQWFVDHEEQNADEHQEMTERIANAEHDIAHRDHRIKTDFLDPMNARMNRLEQDFLIPIMIQMGLQPPPPPPPAPPRP